MFHIRRMVLDDVDAVHSIEKQTFPNPWSKQSFVGEVEDNKKAFYLVAINEKKEVVAYAGLWKIVDEGHITNIAVRPDSRGMGIGKKIIQKLMIIGEEEGLEAFTLEVRESNKIAINLYLSLGFLNAGSRKNYYANPKEDAVIMWRRKNKVEI